MAQPLTPPPPLVLIACALVYYALLWPMSGPDMTVYLVPWYTHILAYGPVGAFAHPFSNYSPPYLYLLSAATLFGAWLSPVAAIKALGIALTIPLAWAMHRLLRAGGADHAGRWALMTLVLPATVINAPLLSQCDALWSAACLCAVAAAIERRPVALAAWAGAAFAIKAQSAFLAPFVVAVLIAQRAPLKAWAAAPIAFGLLLAPAWFAGWPLSDLLTVYLRQVDYKTWAGSLPNPWLFHPIAGLAPGTGFRFGYLAAAAFALAYVVRASRVAPTRDRLLALALLSALAIPYLLPKMHERFWFLADMLAFALAVTAPSRRTLTIALCVQAGSLIGMVAYLVDIHAIALLGVPFATAAIALLAEDALGWPRWRALTGHGEGGPARSGGAAVAVQP